MPDHESETPAAHRKPGLILAPFGWAAVPIFQLAILEPRLMAHLMDLDSPRFHALALYLAHKNEEDLAYQDAAILASARSRDILKAAIGRQPNHLMGLLRRLPEYALRRENYLHLAEMESNQLRSQVLMRNYRIIDLTVAKLVDVPELLLRGPLLQALRGDLLKLAGVAQICRWLGRLWRIEAMADYAAARSRGQVRQITMDLLREVPPIGFSPPRIVGQARLIESTDELRRVGRAAKNCLAHFAGQQTRGEVAFYVWDEEDEEAAIYVQVRRPMGFGWFLGDMKHAGNRAVLAAQAAIVHSAFETAGIASSDIADSLVALLLDEELDCELPIGLTF